MSVGSTWIGSGSILQPPLPGSPVTAVTAETPLLASSGGVTPQISPTATMKALAIGAATVTAAVQVSTHRDVTVQLKDAVSANVGASALATVWVSDTAGGVPSVAPPDGGVTVTTGTVLKIDTTDVLFRVVSGATGVIVLRLVDSGTPTFFVNVAIGTKVVSSAAIVFA